MKRGPEINAWSCCADLKKWPAFLEIQTTRTFPKDRIFV